MSEMLTISCPHCAARLKVKDRSKGGKEVACPSCKGRFVVQLPAAPDEAYGLSDDPNAASEAPLPAFVPETRPARKPPETTMPRSWVIGGAAVATLLFVGLVFLAGRMFSGGSKGAEKKSD